MLEQNFTQLDDDFITVCSKYLVTSQMDIEKLQDLARLGQINAVQLWYFFKKVGDDVIIDKIAEGYSDSHFHKLVAKALYHLKKTDEIELRSQLIKKANEHYKNFKDSMMPVILGGFNVEELVNAENLHRDIKSLPQMQYISKAKYTAYNAAKASDNPLMRAAYNEILQLNSMMTPFVEDRAFFEREAKKNSLKIVKSILKSNMDLKSKGAEPVTKQPDKSFALAKAILLSENKKLEPLAMELLHNLAKRDLAVVKVDKSIQSPEKQ